ncbi:MAG: response regulator [Clostridia bacterium]
MEKIKAIEESDGRMIYRQSLELLKTIIQHCGVLCWVYNINGNSCFYKSKSLEDLGELEGFGVLETLENYPQTLIEKGIIHESSANDFLQIHEQIKQGKKHIAREIRVIENGTSIWKKIKYTTFFDSDGKPTRAIGTAENIDTYKRLEEIYTQAAKQSGLTYWMFDVDEKTIYDFSNATPVDPYKNVSIIPNVPESIITSGMLHQDDAPAFLEMYDKIFSGAPFAKSIARWKGLNKDIWKWYEITYTTIFDDVGRPIKAIGSAIDISDRIKLEERYTGEFERRKIQSREAIGSFKLNLTKNICCDGMTQDPEILKMQEDGTADAFFALDHQRCVDPKARAEYAKIFNRQVLIKNFQDGNRHFSHEHLFRFSNNRIGWALIKIVTMQNPKTYDIEAYIYAIDIDQRKVAQDIVAAVIAMDYDYLALLDVKTDICTVFGLSDKKNSVLPLVVNDYENGVEDYARKHLVEEDIERNIYDMSYANLLEKLEERATFTTYCRVKDQDGKVFQKKLQFFYLDKTRQQILVTRSDITDIYNEEQRKNETLKNALSAAQQANTAKSEFLSHMSHEIRTPMNAIIGMSALAAQSINDPKQVSECLSKVGISARFLLSLINDILDMSRIESGKVLIKQENIPFQDFINGINAICYEQAQQKGIDYDSILESFTEDNYIGDAMKLQQILINIISNAIKFTDRGGKVQFIIAQKKIKKDEAVMRFTVNDTGIGISEEFLPHLFDPFEQAHTGSTSIFGGTGLGLAICKNLVDLMDGRISVNSIEGIGSEFIVEINLGISEESKKTAKLKSYLNLTAMKALIIDDDIMICQHTERILTDMGMKAEWVDSGIKAVDIARKKWEGHEYFDIILVDWKMPDMDGIETTKKLREILGPDVTIIIMTAYDWGAIETEAKKAGVNIILSKPLFKESLSSAFEKIYRGKRVNIKTEAPKQYDFLGKRVLLVEDHILNIEIAKRLLEAKNISVDIAENGLRAIERFAQKETGYYNLILMDIRMPIMDGLTAARAIRQMRKPNAKTIPIIAMTANAFDEDIEKTKSAGMNAHLTKPIDPLLLYNTIDDFLKEV